MVFLENVDKNQTWLPEKKSRSEANSALDNTTETAPLVNMSGSVQGSTSGGPAHQF